MTARTIRTDFFESGSALPVQKNLSTDANRAVAQAVYMLQINRYGARVAQVYDIATGELHADLRRKMNGSIIVLYARNPQEYETRFSVTHLLGGA